jgi:hypothetical protein
LYGTDSKILSNGMSEYKIKTKVKEAGMFCLRKE